MSKIKKDPEVEQAFEELARFLLKLYREKKAKENAANDN